MRLGMVVLLGSLLLSFYSPETTAATTPGYETVTGCLELAASGDYVLRGPDEEITLRNAGGMDKHVGRTVRVTGEWQEAEGGRRMRVAKIEYVAEGCAS